MIGSGNDSLGRRRSFGIGHELALILPRFPLLPGHAFRQDRPRSWPDRASISLQILTKTCLTIVEFFHEASGSSDEASKMMDGPIAIHTVLLDHQDREKSQPSDDSIKMNPR